MLAGEAAHLLRRLDEADHAGRADRVRREHAAGHVDGEVTVELCHAILDELPALVLGCDPARLQPHGLEPAERDVELRAVDLTARIADAGLGVHRLRALTPRPWVHAVAACA